MPITVSRPRRALAFALCAAALLAAPPVMAAPADTLNTPPVPVTMGVWPTSPCHGDSVWVTAASHCSPCIDIVSFARGNDGHLRLEINQMSAAACGSIPCEYEEARAPIGVLAAGHHMVDVEVTWHYPPDSLGGGGTRVVHKWVEFDVGICPGPPPLPFVETVFIGGPPPCATCLPTACPDVPIVVGLQGALPNHCWTLLGFEELPLMSPMDRPVLRLTVRSPNPLVDLDCPDVPNPFSVGTSIAPRPPGIHELEIQVAVRGWEDSTSLQIYSRAYSYAVRDTCPPVPPPVACVWPFLEPSTRIRPDTTLRVPRCDLRLLPGGEGPITFAARSQVTPLAGLQGEFSTSPYLRIVNIEPAGAAAGMRLTWAPKENGATYVLFTGHGAPIPADAWAPVLRVTVRADSGLADVTGGHVYNVVRAASDSNGTSVGICPIMTLVVPAAIVCIGPVDGCDANGDGTSNVADLVRMVRCLLEPAWCPDSAAARPDCTGDGEFHTDDVFCCARAILGLPHEGPGRDPGNLRFSFGEPAMDGPILRVPLRVQGADDLAGALLRLDYPSDRWIAIHDESVIAPASAAATGGWTPLVEPGADDVLVGLLRLDETAPADLGVTLTFRLRDGAEPGGVLRVGASDVMAGDGATFDLDLTSLSAALEPGTSAPASGIALSAARPNPSSGATSFVVSLPAAGNVELAMYDLAGRRVATLWRGALPAGSREFTWQPGRAPSGVYFARLSVDGEVRSSRVTLRLSR